MEKWKQKKSRRRLRRRKADKRLAKIIESMVRPFERLCLYKWTFRTRAAALIRARKRKVVHCRWCNNWHIVDRKETYGS